LSSIGDLFFADCLAHRVRVIYANNIIVTYAGSGTQGFGGDGGLATSSKLWRPYSVYVDASGYVFIADRCNDRIRKIDSSNIITTFAGGGVGGDGSPASSASVSAFGVYDVKGDRVGNIYFADNCKIRMVNPAGIISTIVGTGTCGFMNAFSLASTALINVVASLWVDSSFNIYSCETPGVIHKTGFPSSPTSQPSSQPTRQPSMQPASSPSSQPSSQPSFQPTSCPSVSHQLFSRHQHEQLYLLPFAGNPSYTAGYNGENLLGTDAEVIPFGVWGSSSSGNLFVGDSSGRIRKYTSSTGRLNTYAGTDSSNPVKSTSDYVAATNAIISGEIIVWGDSYGFIYYYAAGLTCQLRQISNSSSSPIVTTLVGMSSGFCGFNDDNLDGTSTAIYHVRGMSSFLTNLYFTDQLNHRVRFYSFSSKQVKTIAGTGSPGYQGDNGPASSALIHSPFGLTVDTLGNVYFSDYANNLIRKITTTASPNQITTIVGTGMSSYDGGNSIPVTSANLGAPTALHLDTVSNILYVSETYSYVIRRFSLSAGIMTIFAGMLFENGDVKESFDAIPATSSRIGTINSISSSPSGDICFADTNNYRVRCVSASTGIITGVVGNGYRSYYGDSGPATSGHLYQPEALLSTKSGYVFISDYRNCRIRRVSSSGIITTVGGSGYKCGNSPFVDHLPLTSSFLRSPNAMWVDTKGNMYFASNGLIRKAYVDVSGVYYNTTTLSVPVAFTSQSIGLWGDSSGNAPFYSDFDLQQVYKVSLTSPAAATELLAGNGQYGFNGENVIATLAKMTGLYYIWGNSIGDLFIPDRFNRRIRKVSYLTSVSSLRNLTTVIGTGSQSFNGDGLLAIETNIDPTSVIGDTLGNLYFTDNYNNRVRMMDYLTTIITTVIGNGGTASSPSSFSLQLATAAPIENPYHLMIDTNGDLYINLNARSLIYKTTWLINPTSQPSSVPSNQPTRQPSRQPSSQPTFQPSIPISSSSLKEGLVAYYPFDEGSANDKSGNGNNGLKRGGVSSVVDRFGRNSAAINFDGTSGYIEIPQGNRFNFAVNMSISFWISPSVSNPSGSYIFDKSFYLISAGRGVDSWAMYISSLAIQFLVSYSPTDNDDPSPVSVTQNVWTHVVLVKRGTSLFAYRNGLLVTQKLSAFSVIPPNGNLPLLMGALNRGRTSPASVLNNYYAGVLDDVFIYNRSLSSSEVLQLYSFDNPSSQPSGQPSSQPSSQPTIQPTFLLASSSLKKGLVAYYPFDKGSANDKSGNGNNGLKRGGVRSVEDRFGRSGDAISFDGSSGYIEIPHGNSFNFAVNMSISFWMKPGMDNPAVPYLFDKSFFSFATGQSVDGWSIRGASFTVQYLFISSLALLMGSTPLSVTQNAWTHVTIVKKDFSFFSFRNGLLVAVTPLSNSVMLQNGNLPLLIGAVNKGRTFPASLVYNYFNGTIDDVLIYSRSLSLWEIQLLYSLDNPTSQPSKQPSAQPSRYPTRQPSSQPTLQPSVSIVASSLKEGLVAYYPFDEGSVNDKSGNGNDGLKRGGVSSVTDRIGRSGHAMSFDGYSGYVEIPRGSRFNFFYKFQCLFVVKSEFCAVDQLFDFGQDVLGIRCYLFVGFWTK
jgi:hypothetical protein